MRKLLWEEILSALAERYGPLKIAMLGLGAINKSLLKLIHYRGLMDAFQITLGVDIDDTALDKFKALSGDLGIKPVLTNRRELLWEADHQVVIEAASLKAVRDNLEPILRSGKWFILMSLGALIGWEKYSRLRSEGLTRKLYISGGAIGPNAIYDFLDLLELESLKLSTSKPPRSLGLSSADKPSREVILTGNIDEAIRRFPRNVNVSAYLKYRYGELLGDNLAYELISDPSLSVNQHSLSAKFSIGEMELTIRSQHLLENPRTSAITVYSLYHDLISLGLRIYIERFLKANSG